MKEITMNKEITMTMNLELTFVLGCGEENAERFEIIKQEVGNIFAKSIEDSIPGVQDAHAYDVKVFINDRKNN